VKMFDAGTSRKRQTDGQTDRIAISISRVSLLTRDKNRDFRPISRFISEVIQDKAIVLMEDELVCDLSNGAIFSDLE